MAEVEAFQGLLVAEVGTPQALVQFLLVAACDFVKDQQAEEVGVGQLAVDGLPVAGLQRIQDAGQPQLFEQGDEFWDGVHGVSSMQQCLWVAAEVAALGVGVGQFDTGGRRRDVLIQPLGEDGLDGP